jgi:hypothetical protein
MSRGPRVDIGSRLAIICSFHRDLNVEKLFSFFFFFFFFKFCNLFVLFLMTFEIWRHTTVKLKAYIYVTIRGLVRLASGGTGSVNWLLAVTPFSLSCSDRMIYDR